MAGGSKVSGVLKPGSRRVTVCASAAGQPKCMATHPSQTKPAVRVNSVSVKASSRLAAPRRKWVRDAAASSSMGTSSTKVFEGRAAAVLI